MSILTANDYLNVFEIFIFKVLRKTMHEIMLITIE